VEEPEHARAPAARTKHESRTRWCICVPWEGTVARSRHNGWRITNGRVIHGVSAQ
jgi:hypothetical protein